MLKIKSNIDLKELEKFGFIEEYNWYEKEKEFCTGDLLRYFINKNNRTIEVSTYDGVELCLDNTLYDLIKADLVEKVDE